MAWDNIGKRLAPRSLKLGSRQLKRDGSERGRIQGKGNSRKCQALRDNGYVLFERPPPCLLNLGERSTVIWLSGEVERDRSKDLAASPLSQNDRGRVIGITGGVQSNAMLNFIHRSGLSYFIFNSGAEGLSGSEGLKKEGKGRANLFYKVYSWNAG